MAGKRVVKGLTWEEPPPGSRGPNKNHQDVALVLKANPGVWAKIGTYASSASSGSTAHFVRTGRLKAFRPAGAFEATARTVEGEHFVYARYVGD